VGRANQGARGLSLELRHCYASPALRLLSFWACSAAAVEGWTGNYGTSVFADIDPAADANGHVTFATRALCLAAAAGAARIEAPAAAAGPLVYATGAAVTAAALAVLAGARQLPPAYAAYATTLAVLQGCACLQAAQSGHALNAAAASAGGTPAVGDAPSAAPRPRLALLFAANAVLALAAQAALQAGVAAARLAAQPSFALLSPLACLLAVVMALAALVHRRSTGSWRLVGDAAQDAPGGAEGVGGLPGGVELAPLLGAPGEASRGEREA